MSHAKEKAFFQGLMRSHKQLGVALGIFIFALCFTGTISLFHSELSVWENATLSSVAAPPSGHLEDLPVDKIMQQSIDTYGGPDGKDVEVFYVSQDMPGHRFAISGTHTESDEAWHTSYWDASTGELITHQDSGLSHIIAEIHTDFWLPSPWGRYAIGVLGVIFMMLAVAGLLVHRHWRKESDQLRLEKPRHKWSDLHKLAGFWALPFHVVIGFTGALLGLLGVILIMMALVAYNGDQDAAIADIFGKDPVMSEESAPIPSMIPFVEKSREDMREGFNPQQVMAVYPGDKNMFVLINGNYPQTLGIDSFAKYRVDTGETIKLVDYIHDNVALRVYSASVPLHYATFGGVEMKFLYFVLGLMSCLLPATGLFLWLRRRAFDWKARMVYWGLLSLPVATATGFVMALATKWLPAFTTLSFAKTAIHYAGVAFVLGLLLVAFQAWRSQSVEASFIRAMQVIMCCLAATAVLDIVLQLSKGIGQWAPQAWGADLMLLLMAGLAYFLKARLQEKTAADELSEALA
ncbi:PepSY-associated TM helix domain-containing protein [Pseudoteredinibacter isoporae]|uniref:Putative iron-regulated membrane protein n=1 Tax=Pseudoteredinibacter isoporae TaxID=570281 RepID=A0A7X0JS06_9GAMM|nr:PepSY-associated TM helix domain-containing protein [Pseudoteredinibacter isoporae]MBB6520583.1 putative iron-regulated membrane protein [Pseudoteredinibacter isoporae]NHO86150.1 PepSY domain-containing protein [Pseudoteredinibacter isoporae]NIB25399.1 PepSY domain-containing protein [Pseudoteredinibacter isoporae]